MTDKNNENTVIDKAPLAEDFVEIEVLSEGPRSEESGVLPEDKNPQQNNEAQESQDSP